jgi:hypothetical protein
MVKTVRCRDSLLVRHLTVSSFSRGRISTYRSVPNLHEIVDVATNNHPLNSVEKLTGIQIQEPLRSVLFQCSARMERTQRRNRMQFLM